MQKRTINRILVSWAILLILVACFGRVSFAASNAGQTAADFLTVGYGARSAGFGGAFTAVSEGAYAAYWNPAGLAQLDRKEVALSHFLWYQDISLEQGAMAIPVSDRVGLGFAITYVNYGKIDGYDDAGVSTGDISAYDMAGGVSVGYAVSDRMTIGVTGKVITQKLATYSAVGFAGDFGFKYSAGRVVLAGAVSNVGSSLKFDQESEKLPSEVRLGIGVTPFGDNVLAALEINKSFYGDLTVHQGVEVGFRDQYFVRGGVGLHPSQDGRSLGSGFSLGAGVKLGNAGIDYAFTLGDQQLSEELHRFSLAFRF